ncbi:MAG: DUF2726 domain-containing protein [Minisyncoccia bacterium]
MMSVFWLAIFVLVILGITWVVQMLGTSVLAGTVNSAPSFRKRESIMNKSESAFFYELRKQLSSEYHIFPNMRIADIIDAVDGKGFYRRRNKILPKHIDFLICDRYFKPIVAVEVNGSSHHRADRIERDELVKEIFAEAKLPLEFVNVGVNFDQAVKKIAAHLS